MKVISTYGHGNTATITTVLDDDTIINHKHIDAYFTWCSQHNVKIHPMYDESIYPTQVRIQREKMNNG